MKWRIQIFLIMLMIIGVWSGKSFAESASDVAKVENAWIKAMPASAEYSSAYFSITNHSPKDIVLNQIRCDLAKNVEIHEMNMVDGKMKMRALKEMVIPQGQTIVLKPGGAHVMLINLVNPLREGQVADLVLVFSDGSEQKVSAVIQKEAEMNEGDGY